MEEIAWKRDQTPYYIFACHKCGQYMYAKTVQKTKKCLRCGKHHQVGRVKSSSEIVNGISNAVEMVKLRQNELAIKKLGARPELRANGDFKVAKSLFKTHGQFPKEKSETDEYETKFKEMLIEISSMYDAFPYYVLEVMADNHGIPSKEVTILTRNYLKEGFLIRLENNSYKVKIR